MTTASVNCSRCGNAFSIAFWGARCPSCNAPFSGELPEDAGIPADLKERAAAYRQSLRKKSKSPFSKGDMGIYDPLWSEPLPWRDILMASLLGAFGLLIAVRTTSPGWLLFGIAILLFAFLSTIALLIRPHEPAVKATKSLVSWGTHFLAAEFISAVLIRNLSIPELVLVLGSLLVVASIRDSFRKWDARRREAEMPTSFHRFS
jgi:hypothetical protein